MEINDIPDSTTFILINAPQILLMTLMYLRMNLDEIKIIQKSFLIRVLHNNTK